MKVVIMHKNTNILMHRNLMHLLALVDAIKCGSVSSNKKMFQQKYPSNVKITLILQQGPQYARLFNI